MIRTSAIACMLMISIAAGRGIAMDIMLGIAERNHGKDSPEVALFRIQCYPLGSISASELNRLVKKHAMLRQAEVNANLSPMHIAALQEAKNPGSIAALIKLGVLVDQVNNSHETALMHVLVQRLPHACKILLDSKASVTVRDHFGRDALLNALREPESLPLAQMLLDHPSMQPLVNLSNHIHHTGGDHLYGKYKQELNISYIQEAMLRRGLQARSMQREDEVHGRVALASIPIDAAYAKVIEKMLEVGALVDIQTLKRAVMCDYCNVTQPSNTKLVVRYSSLETLIEALHYPEIKGEKLDEGLGLFVYIPHPRNARLNPLFKFAEKVDAQHLVKSELEKRKYPYEQALNPFLLPPLVAITCGYVGFPD